MSARVSGRREVLEKSERSRGRVRREVCAQRTESGGAELHGHGGSGGEGGGGVCKGNLHPAESVRVCQLGITVSVTSATRS